jgi:hypothetical protein
MDQINDFIDYCFTLEQNMEIDDAFLEISHSVLNTKWREIADSYQPRKIHEIFSELKSLDTNLSFHVTQNVLKLKLTICNVQFYLSTVDDNVKYKVI